MPGYDEQRAAQGSTIPPEVLAQIPERRGAIMGGGPQMMSQAEGVLAARVAELAEEVREYNVQVNCISPGPTYTHLTDQVLRAGKRAGEKALAEAMHLRSNGGTPPEKQIQLALFLASERSDHVSGKLIHINDDLKRLEKNSLHRDAFTLRRIQRV